MPCIPSRPVCPSPSPAYNLLSFLLASKLGAALTMLFPSSSPSLTCTTPSSFPSFLLVDDLRVESSHQLCLIPTIPPFVADPPTGDICHPRPCPSNHHRYPPSLLRSLDGPNSSDARRRRVVPIAQRKEASSAALRTSSRTVGVRESLSAPVSRKHCCGGNER